MREVDCEGSYQPPPERAVEDGLWWLGGFSHEVPCPVCGRPVKVSKLNQLYRHKRPADRGAST